MTCDNKDDCGDNSDESSAAGCIPWPGKFNIITQCHDRITMCTSIKVLHY